MAVTNLHQFQLGLRKFAERAEKRGKDRVKAVALEGLRGLVFGTRVDLGRARGNWQVGEARPPTGYNPDLFDKDGNKTIARGSRVILAASGDDIIWLHNGVPYITELEKLDKMLAGTVELLKTRIRST